MCLCEQLHSLRCKFAVLKLQSANRAAADFATSVLHALKVSCMRPARERPVPGRDDAPALAIYRCLVCHERPVGQGSSTGRLVSSTGKLLLMYCWERGRHFGTLAGRVCAVHVVRECMPDEWSGMTSASSLCRHTASQPKGFAVRTLRSQREVREVHVQSKQAGCCQCEWQDPSWA